MNVLFIVDVWYPFLGGGIKHVEEIAERLTTDYGHSVTVVTRNIRSADNGQPAYTQPHFHLVRLGAPSAVDSWWSRLRFLVQAYRYGRSMHNLTLVHGQANLGGIPAWVLAKTRHIPVLYTVHGTGIGAWSVMRPGLGGRLMEYVEKFLQCRIRYSAEISVDKKFFELPNVNQRRYVVRNGVNEQVFTWVSTSQRQRHTVLFVGRFHVQKDIVTLLRAFRLLPWTDKVLRLVGDGPERAMIERTMNDLGLQSSVQLLGALQGKELITEYQRAGVFALSSLYEGQPVTILESWSTGLPVAVTDVGENPYMVTGLLGKVVQTQNPQQLAQAIESIADDPAYDVRSLACRKEVEQQYTWDTVTKKISAIYHELVA